MNRLKRLILSSIVLFSPLTVIAASPFNGCPTEAFLFQGEPANVYAVDLATGNYHIVSTDTGAGGVINAVGFNETDRYIYGWNKAPKTITRINQAYQVEDLTVQSGLPANKSFFVGDIFDNTYYLYLKGSGMFKIDLSQGDDNLVATTIMTASEATLTLTDFAFYPDTGELFAVENTNNDLYLFSFDSSGNANATKIGSTGLSGKTTFGAQYFDKSGFMYISNNHDGKIYRLDLRDLGAIESTAEFFASGPSSNKNDGARCASALVTSSNTDFGDAPDSYKTSLEENGPRHFIGPNLYFGAQIDSESIAAISPSSDDNNGSPDDEDGISFATDFKQGSDVLINITIGGEAVGYVSGWFDWDGDNTFNGDNEQAITDEYLFPGSHTLKVRVPEDAKPGTTWARFRIGKDAGLNYFGGITYGEVEDYPVTIEEQSLTHNYYPGEGTWVTLAYEDNWPAKGDYDFNDVVIFYRVDTISNQAGNIIRYDIHGKLQAYGASFANGFAVQLDNISRSIVDADLAKLVVNDKTLHNTSIIEEGQEFAVALISNNLKNEFTPPECSGNSGKFYRVWRGCTKDAADQFSFVASIPLTSPISTGPDMPLNPFIFSPEGRYHGDNFSMEFPGRALEIHLKGDSVTSLASEQFFSTQEDKSIYSSSNCPGPDCDSFRGENGTPWGLVIDSNWDHPSERIDVLQAYPELAEFANSGGSQNTDWHKRTKAVISKLFQ
ncbi:LruC domain-containing protein [Photobacterium sp. SDRW27]|uniref:LruC domain-containing protein n=1 Tax=Photobacterium obscurum TaxID=2829490 RepID=UPI002243E3DE|nr:LruC domain-containing protein [Photobacterium obscurum]MCW8327924.1 LruC domain-containing protein [Photobacterium obscurum]